MDLTLITEILVASITKFLQRMKKKTVLKDKKLLKVIIKSESRA